jgi:hypothetical protein
MALPFAVRAFVVASLLATGCGAGAGSATPDAQVTPVDGGGAGAPDARPAPDAGGAAPDAGTQPGDIATWTDGPGACPQGLKRVELSTMQQIQDATRGDGAYAGDPPDTCYLVRNGTYAEGGALLFYVLKGGSASAARRFVGESRSGVVVHGRANVADGADHVIFENMTFDLTGFVKSGSFNTFDVSAASDVTLTHMTFTGDCATGLRGGHIEVVGGTSVVIDSCIVEKFGHCGAGGHEDHGIYLASGSDITVRNSIIRGNSSRGILFNTQQGDYGQIRRVLVEGNRIHDNGHGDYEDGIAVNMEGTGNVDDVVIRRNLIYGNYHSGLRFVGTVTSGFDVERNTFHGNGQRSTHAGRSNLNLDDSGSGAHTVATKNIFAAAKAMLNDCYDATPRGFSVADNLVFASSITTGASDCVSATVTLDPGFAGAAGGDFHTASLGAAGYGAY